MLLDCICYVKNNCTRLIGSEITLILLGSLSEHEMGVGAACERGCYNGVLTWQSHRHSYKAMCIEDRGESAER